MGECQFGTLNITLKPLYKVSPGNGLIRWLYNFSEECPIIFSRNGLRGIDKCLRVSSLPHGYTEQQQSKDSQASHWNCQILKPTLILEGPCQFVQYLMIFLSLWSSILFNFLQYLLANLRHYGAPAQTVIKATFTRYSTHCSSLISVQTAESNMLLAAQYQEEVDPKLVSILFRGEGGISAYTHSQVDA